MSVLTIVPQICVQFNEEDYAEIEQMATDSHTTQSRVVARLVAYAIRQEQLAFGDVQNEIDSISQERDRLMSRIALLEQQSRDRESELGFLRQEFAKLTQILSHQLRVDVNSKRS